MFFPMYNIMSDSEGQRKSDESPPLPPSDNGETLVLAFTTHGAVLTKRMEDDQVKPVNFKTPLKIIKYSAVTFGECNIVEDKIIKNNIEHLIEQFKTRKINWNLMSDDDIISNLKSITQKYKDDHTSLAEGATKSDLEEWSKSELQLDKYKLGFVHTAELGHTINTYDINSEVTDKLYSLADDSHEKTADAIYSDKILLFTLRSTFDLYGQLLEQGAPGVLLSDIIQSLSLIGQDVSRIVIIDFTCNESLEPVSDREKRMLRKKDNAEGAKLGGKKKKTRNNKKTKKTKKSKKSRRKL
jgi:hypothetical protein